MEVNCTQNIGPQLGTAGLSGGRFFVEGYCSIFTHYKLYEIGRYFRFFRVQVFTLFFVLRSLTRGAVKDYQRVEFLSDRVVRLFKLGWRFFYSTSIRNFARETHNLEKEPLACSVDYETQSKRNIYISKGPFFGRFCTVLIACSKIGYMIENSVNKSGVKLDELENM